MFHLADQEKTQRQLMVFPSMASVTFCRLTNVMCKDVFQIFQKVFIQHPSDPVKPAETLEKINE